MELLRPNVPTKCDLGLRRPPIFYGVPLPYLLNGRLVRRSRDEVAKLKNRSGDIKRNRVGSFKSNRHVMLDKLPKCLPKYPRGLIIWGFLWALLRALAALGPGCITGNCVEWYDYCWTLSREHEDLYCPSGPRVS